MCESLVTPHTIEVGPDLVNVVLNLSGGYTFYVNVCGTSFKVLRTDSSPHGLIVDDTPIPTIDLNWKIKFLPNYFKDGNKLSIYAVLPTSTLAGELTPVEVGADVTHELRPSSSQMSEGHRAPASPSIQASWWLGLTEEQKLQVRTRAAMEGLRN